jgi:hypothetical protein
MEGAMIFSMEFDEWMQALRKDCGHHGKLLVVDNMGDYVLEALWRNGVEPSVAGIIRQSTSMKPSNLPEIVDYDA